MFGLSFVPFSQARYQEVVFMDHAVSFQPSRIESPEHKRKEEIGNKRKERVMLDADGKRHKGDGIDLVDFLRTMTGKLNLEEPEGKKVSVNVQVFGTYDNPWFLAADVGNVLGLGERAVQKKCRDMAGLYYSFISCK